MKTALTRLAEGSPWAVPVITEARGPCSASLQDDETPTEDRPGSGNACALQM